MIAQPKSFSGYFKIEQMEKDPSISGKIHFSGKILEVEDSAKENSFFEEGRAITGFAFNPPINIKAGDSVQADISFMGDPFKQNYELKNILKLE